MKRRLQYTPSTTAHKIHYSPQQYSTLPFQSARKILFDADLMTPSDRRKQHNFRSRVSDLKETLDGIIEAVSVKRASQKGAIQRVHEVNTQLKQQLSREQTVNFGRTRTYNFVPEEKCFDEETTYIDHHRSRISLTSIQEEPSIRLKKDLNQKIKDNNELMARLKSLQHQHEYLRDQSRFDQGAASQYEIEENRRLRDQLSKINQQPSGYTVADLWQEFLQLKQQNERLRQQTITMLKADNKQTSYNQRNEYCSPFAY